MSEQPSAAESHQPTPEDVGHIGGGVRLGLIKRHLCLLLRLVGVGAGRLAGTPAHDPGSAVCQRRNMNSALWIVASINVTVSSRHVPAQALSVFHV